MATPGNTPKVLDAKEVIILSRELECHCGRTKERVHCPNCGKTKLYGYTDRVPGITPNSDMIRNCKRYRCDGCAEKFNDTDWYFFCHAPKRIDVAETKAKLRAQYTQDWINRIKAGLEEFSRNDETQCKSQTGVPFNILQAMAISHKIQQTHSITERIEILKNQIANKEKAIIEDSFNQDLKSELQYLKDKLLKLESQNGETGRQNND